MPDFTLEQLAALLGDSDEEQRRSAVIALKRSAPAASRSLLMTALGDPSWRVRKEATDALLEGVHDRELIGMLIGALAAESNAGLRNAAVEALVALGDTAVPVLVSSLGDADRDTRKFIVDILGMIGNEASRTVLEALLADPDLNVAGAAAESLGRQAAPESLSALVGALERPALWFRYAVLEAIAAIGRPVAAPVVASLAEDRHLRRAVFDCLGTIGDLQAVPLLLAGLGERAPRLAVAAAKALARIRGRLGDVDRDELDRELRSAAGTDLPLRLGELVGEEDDGSEAFVMLLGIIGDPRSAEALVRASRDPRLRSQCAVAFRRMAGDVTAELARLFDEGNAEERAGIMWLCGETTPSGFAGLLLRGCADGSATVRSAAIAAAAGCNDEALVPVLVSCCADPAPEVREEALPVLLRLAEQHPARAVLVAEDLAASKDASLRRIAARLCSPARSGRLLEHLMRDDDPQVRCAAATGLGQIPSAVAREHLALMLTDEDSRVRTVVATVLGRVGGESVFEPLLAALRDEEPDVVCAALRSLEGQGERAFAPVLDMVRRSRGLVLLAAMESLSRIDSFGSVTVLTEFLGDDDSEVVVTALRLLAGQGGTPWLQRYGEGLCSHLHWEVRAAVAEILGSLPAAEGRERLEMMRACEDDPFVLSRIQDSLEGCH